MASSSCSTNFTCSSVNSLILPIVNEATWKLEIRATVYLLGLFWSFMGVSIVADVFMTSIERITSSTRNITIFNVDTGSDEQVEVKVWNDTVANLTLMALGSSAPEILLSIIEIVGNNFTAGDLGPGTIVGSAAFNLLVISAVCVVSVGEEGRRVKQFKVFCVTASFSVLAYLWLVVILVLITPDFVDLWEGVVTFLYFFLLVVIAFLVDKEFCCARQGDDDKEADGQGIGVASTVSLDRQQEQHSDQTANNQIDEDQMRQFLKSVGKDATLTEQELKQLILKRFADKQPHSRAWYRINATRQLMGGHKLHVQLPAKLQSKMEQMESAVGVQGESVASLRTQSALSENNRLAVVEFSSSSVAVLERDQRARLGLRRYGNTKVRAVVKIETVDGTATKNEDYVPLKKTIVFEPEENFQHVDIEIIDDNEWEPDETFFVKLNLEREDRTVTLGPRKINQVTIINDDEPGTFEFENASHLFKESCIKACVPVRRVNGADGTATVTWRTVDQTAKAGFDYQGCDGAVLEFSHGEIEKTIDVLIYDDQEKEKDEHFKIEFTDCSKGAKIGKTSSTIITIVNDDEYNSLVSRLAQATNLDLESIRVDNNTYAQQIKQAMNVNGGDIDNAGNMDYVMHFFTFFWKILFSLIPPPSIWGGWLCFFVSLGMIGLLTALVGDLASIFGCLVGLKDSVTAITFVALGTSLPDLFASKQAALGDPTADNSIGNVTGSNSVNVFLGLGLPWMIAAIYHTAAGNSFNVKAGDLVFSVILYSICSVAAITMLIIRRYVKAFGQCELGGKASLKYVTAAIMVTLWVMYIVLSALKAYNIIQVQL